MKNGFSLFEILVAISLVALVFLLVATVNFSSRDDLNKVFTNIQNLIDTGDAQATIRGKLLRLRFSLDKNPQEYVLEYTDESKITIPNPIDLYSQEAMAKLENEKQRGQNSTPYSSTNMNFNTLDDLEGAKGTIPDHLKILGIGISDIDHLVSSSDVSMYFYPIGERDSLFLALASDSEVGILKVSAFLSNFTLSYETFEIPDYREAEEFKLEFVQRLYRESLTNVK